MRNIRLQQEGSLWCAQGQQVLDTRYVMKVTAVRLSSIKNPASSTCTMGKAVGGH